MDSKEGRAGENLVFYDDREAGLGRAGLGRGGYG